MRRLESPIRCTSLDGALLFSLRISSVFKNSRKKLPLRRMFRIRYISAILLRILDMDPTLLTARLGEQIRQKRLNRGLTQAELAARAGLTRQKVIAVEKGSLSAGMAAYARVLAGLDCELAVVPAAMPTLDDIQGLFE